MKDEVPDESESVNNLILSCYKELDCYLFPDPGRKVTFDSTFNGDVKGQLSKHISTII